MTEDGMIAWHHRLNQREFEQARTGKLGVLQEHIEGTVHPVSERSNQSFLKEVSPEYSLEGLLLKLKLQYFGHLMQRTDSFERP